MDNQTLNKKPVHFIPNLFKLKDKFTITSDTKFLTSNSLDEYSSLFSKSGVPKYIEDSEIPSLLPLLKESLTELQCKEKSPNVSENESTSESPKKTGNKRVHRVFKNQTDKKVYSILDKYRHFFRKVCPVGISMKSQLSHEEHEAYLFLFIKFNLQAPTAAESAQYQSFLSLQDRVYAEQTEFMNFSMKVSNLQLDTYNKVPHFVSDYVFAHIMHRCSRVLSYPQLYIKEQQLPLQPQHPDRNNQSFFFSHLGHLLSLGTLPRMTIPEFEEKHVIISYDDHLASRSPPDTDSKYDSSSYIYKTKISEDPNAEFLAIEHEVDIVISSSAFKLISANVYPPFDRQWEIPVQIKTCNKINEDGTVSDKRIVFIDKPLIKKIWSPAELKLLYYKKSILAQFNDNKPQSYITIHSPKIFTYNEPSNDKPKNSKRRSESVIDYSDDIFDLTLCDNIDKFASAKDYSTVKTPKKKKNKNESDDSSSDKKNKPKKNKTNTPSNTPCTSNNSLESTSKENKRSDNSPCTKNYDKLKPNNSTSKDSGFLDNLLNVQENLLHKQETLPKDKSDSDTFEKKPWNSSLKTDWFKYNSPKGCPPKAGLNYHYHLYKFGVQSSGPTAVTDTPTLRVLVRSNIHGISQPYKKPRKESYRHPDESILGRPAYTKSRHYMVHPKLENQAYFGCEVNTLTEITQQWADLLVRPQTRLLQVRINEDTGNVMLLEDKDLNTVIKDGGQCHINFHANVPLAALFGIFSSLKLQGSGKYIIHHDSKTGAFVNIMKAVDDKRSYHHNILDLHQVYSRDKILFTQYASAPWVAIDTHVLSPFHLKHKKIPGTFPMAYVNQVSKTELKKIKKRLKDKKVLDDMTVRVYSQPRR